MKLRAALSYTASAILLAWGTAATAAPLTDIASIAAGDTHTCALMTGGGVKCWGMAQTIGDGGSTARQFPTDVSGLSSGVQQISASYEGTLALTATGGVKYWGYGLVVPPPPSAILGPIAELVPVSIPAGITGALAVSMGEARCFLTAAGGVKCWGVNRYGELGNGAVGGASAGAPTDVVGLTSGVVAIASGSSHTCALLTGGAMKCWGYNASGQLGDGTNVNRLSPVDVAGLSNGVAAISVGSQLTCALMVSGGVKCWGLNTEGAVGDGTTAMMRLAPVDVVGLSSGVIAVVAGTSPCALTAAGAVKCWGQNYAGQIGDGTTTNRFVPTDVTGLASGVSSISGGHSNNCAVLATGLAKCWGNNGGLQVGNHAAGNSTKVPLTVLAGVTSQTITFAAMANRNIEAPPFTISPSASSGLPVTLTGWDTSVCTLSGTTVTVVGPGFCRIFADQGGDDIEWAPAPRVEQTFHVTGSPPDSAPRLGNLATRMRVGTGDNRLIAGFAISGAYSTQTPKNVVIRARGPSLAASGVTSPLPDPMLGIYAGTTLIASSNDWQTTPSAATVQDIGFAPSDSREAAILMNLIPGLYTVHVTNGGGGGGDGTGVATVEVFEIDNLKAPLVNISTRGEVLTGDNVMIAGFIIHGSGPQTVVINVAGPSLTTAGITNPLVNPMLTLVRSSDNVIIDSNDNWQSSGNAAAIQASGFAPSHPFEPAMRVTLAPGAYTAIVQGVGGTTGIAVVGVFAAP